MNEKLEKLNRELAKGEARLRRAQHEQKILEHQMKQLIKRISAGNVWSRSGLGLCFRKTLFRGNKSLTTIVDSFSKLDLIDNPFCNKEVDQRSENRVVYETGAELLVCEVVVGLNPFVHHVHPLPGLGAICPVPTMI